MQINVQRVPFLHVGYPHYICPVLTAVLLGLLSRWCPRPQCPEERPVWGLCSGPGGGQWPPVLPGGCVQAEPGQGSLHVPALLPSPAQTVLHDAPARRQQEIPRYQLTLGSSHLLQSVKDKTLKLLLVFVHHLCLHVCLFWCMHVHGLGLVPAVSSYLSIP